LAFTAGAVKPYGSNCTSNADCFPGLKCNASNQCWTQIGLFNSPSLVPSCYGSASNTECIASSQCKGLYYCQNGSGSLYCLQGQGQAQPQKGGTTGFPCADDGECFAAPRNPNQYYCETNSSVYGAYGQPVCLMLHQSNIGFCNAHSDCVAGQNANQGFKCSSRQTNAMCNRGSCDLVLQQCVNPTSPIQTFWYNPNCYPQGVVGPQGLSCNATSCNCGS